MLIRYCLIFTLCPILVVKSCLFAWRNLRTTTFNTMTSCYFMLFIVTNPERHKWENLLHDSVKSTLRSDLLTPKEIHLVMAPYRCLLDGFVEASLSFVSLGVSSCLNKISHWLSFKFPEMYKWMTDDDFDFIVNSSRQFETCMLIRSTSISNDFIELRFTA